GPRLVIRVQLALGLGAVTGAHKNARFHAGIPATFKIDQFVADEVAFRQVEAEFVPRIKEELRRWLASSAGLLRRLGSEINFLETNALLCKFASEMLVHLMDILERKIRAPHSRLVRNDEKHEASFAQSPQRRSRARKNDNLFRPMEIILVRNQGAVAIQKNSALHSFLLRVWRSYCRIKSKGTGNEEG